MLRYATFDQALFLPKTCTVSVALVAAEVFVYAQVARCSRVFQDHRMRMLLGVVFRDLELRLPDVLLQLRRVVRFTVHIGVRDDRVLQAHDWVSVVVH